MIKEILIKIKILIIKFVILLIWIKYDNINDGNIQINTNTQNNMNYKINNLGQNNFNNKQPKYKYQQKSYKYK